MRTKKIFSYITTTLNESFVNKLQKCLKPAIYFRHNIQQIYRDSLFFFTFGTKLPNNQLICFPAWFVKLVVMTRGEICCRSSITLLSEIRLTKKARRTFYYRLRHTKISVFFSSCAALTINYFLISD